MKLQLCFSAFFILSTGAVTILAETGNPTKTHIWWVATPRKRAFDRLDVSSFDFNKRFLIDEQQETAVPTGAPPSPLVKLFVGIHRSLSELPIVRKLAEGVKRRRWDMLGKQYRQQQLHNQFKLRGGRGRMVPGVHGFGLSGALRLKRK